MDGNASSKPAHGDIVLFSKGTDHEGHLIAIVPGSPKLRFSTYERALSVAQALASQRGAGSSRQSSVARGEAGRASAVAPPALGPRVGRPRAAGRVRGGI